MPLGKAVVQIINSKTAAPSASTLLTDCVTIDTFNVLMLGIEVSVMYNLAAALGCTVNVYGSYDGVNFDVDPYDSWNLTFAAGTTHSFTRTVVPAPRYLKVLVQNLDLGQSLTGINAWAHRLTG
jgi:hypothetical protein